MLSVLSLQAQEQSADRWKETRRLDHKKKEQGFTDTLRLSGVNKQSMMLRKGAFQYKGEVNNDVLDLGYTNMHIIKNTSEEIQLGDEDYIHIFSREQKDLSAADAVVKKNEIDLPEKPVQEVRLPWLYGSWNAYKRTGKNGPLQKLDYKKLITGLTVTEQKDKEGYMGTVVAGGSAPLYLVRECQGSTIRLTDPADQSVHSLTVWRQSADELVVEDEYGIIYYMKHFR